MLWIILVCLNCDVDSARALGWRSEAVLAEPSSLFSWDRSDDRTFATRQQCMRTVRRENPETDWSAPDRFGQIEKTTHFPDYVERFQSIPLVQNGAMYAACFSVSPPVS